MSALFNKIEAVGKKKDLEEAKEIEDIDMSQIDPSAAGEKVVCPRCKKDVLKDHFDSHMTAHSSEILPWLFLGGKRNLENDQEITVRTNITHVLNLAQEVNLKADIKEIATEYNRERDLPFVYKKLNFGDTPDQDILSELESAIEFIHEAHSSNERHNVLVNCVQGISRSASVVLAYLMKYERMSLRAAYDHVRERRAVADPRKEFLDQLAVFECKLFDVDKPTLTGAIVFEGRNLLNVDDATPLSQPCREPPSTSAPAKEQIVTADPQAESTFIEDISNKPARAAATSYESVSDWYTDENPADSPTKTTSEWYLDGKPRPSTRTSQTEVHVMDEATVQPQS
ncbi:DUSP16 [Symbiodinium natans]|uniref:protein-tyrosine-phosphatase n=1 Tax=Symbiodinium natans TaxID=878477 RepID=A0A812KHZ5_9DINO|nr:DUSP16 [Symbiodinium natans]